MNRWRYVSYADDGCDTFQCLKCKKSFTGRTACAKDGITWGFYYCGFCGTKWEGEHDWGHDRQDYYPHLRTYKSILPLWSIQKRTMRRNPEGVWEHIHGLGDSQSGDPVWKNLHYMRGNARTARNFLDYYRGVSSPRSSADKEEEEEDKKFSEMLGIRFEHRCIVLKEGTREFEEAKTVSNYEGRAQIDWHFYKEYQKQWGGKMHHSERERTWFLRPTPENQV